MSDVAQANASSGGKGALAPAEQGVDAAADPPSALGMIMPFKAVTRWEPTKPLELSDFSVVYKRCFRHAKASAR